MGRLAIAELFLSGLAVELTITGTIYYNQGLLCKALALSDFS